MKDRTVVIIVKADDKNKVIANNIAKFLMHHLQNNAEQVYRFMSSGILSCCLVNSI